MSCRYETLLTLDVSSVFPSHKELCLTLIHYRAALKGTVHPEMKMRLLFKLWKRKEEFMWRGQVWWPKLEIYLSKQAYILVVRGIIFFLNNHFELFFFLNYLFFWSSKIIVHLGLVCVSDAACFFKELKNCL